jgi:hypothetical protein
MSIRKKIQDQYVVRLLILTLLAGGLLLGFASVSAAASFTIEEKTIYTNNGQNNFWWTHLRCTPIPNGVSPDILCTVSKDPNESPNLSDVFYDIAYTKSSDLGETWSSFTTIPQYQWKVLPDGYSGMLIDPVPVYHAQSGKVIVFGMAQSYDVAHGYAKKHNYPAYAIYDPASSTWSSDWYLFSWPQVYGHAGSVYPYMTEDGSILWPLNSLDGLGTLQVVKASFDGSTLQYVNQSGTVANVGINGNRSGIEPSLTRFNNEYFLTIRDDTQNRLAKSSDGLTWQSAVTLKWDDGTTVTGSNNTQMHWLTQSGVLYLVYTRQDASNSDIFRYRAPLWMAEVDPITLRLKKSTERIAMGITSNRAQLGNFGTTAITPKLSLVTSNEWNTVVPNRAIISFIRWDRSLLGSWPLDETSGSIAGDATGNGNNGTIVNAVYNTNGKFGGSLTFAGNGDYVNLGDPSSGAFDFGTTQNFSVSAWVKTNSSGGIKYMVNKGDTNASYWLRFEANNTIKFLLDYGSTYDAAQSTVTYTDGKWHHVIGTADRIAGLKLYVDGVLVGQDSSLTGGNISNALPLTIGANSTNTMNGQIDEVKLFGYALTSKEVQAVYGLTAHWKLDEASGAAALDATGNGNDGTIVNVVRTANGKFGGALSFAGSGDYVTVNDPADGNLDFGATQDFSVSAWVNTSAAGTTKYIVNKGDTNHGYWLRFEANNTLRFLLDYNSTADATQTTATYTDGQWHHVVGVASRSTGLKLYVDGVLAGTNNSLTGGDISSSLPLTLGHAAANTMNGLLDDVRIYNYALSAADIQTLYTP